MRKIEQWMIDTIQTQRAKEPSILMYDGVTSTNDNTMVCTRLRYDREIVTTIYLHGNLIASYSGGEGGFKMCGFPTQTTKSRINALALAFGRNGVYTKNGKHYSGNQEVNDYDWF